MTSRRSAQRMEGLGNEKARELYGEAGGVRVSEEVDAEVLEVHVRDKYSRIKAAPGPLPSASGKLYRCEPLPGEDSAGEAAREPVQSGATEAEGTARQPALAAVPGPSVAKPKPKLASSARSASSSTTKPKPKKAAGSKVRACTTINRACLASRTHAQTLKLHQTLCAPLSLVHFCRRRLAQRSEAQARRKSPKHRRRLCLARRDENVTVDRP